MRGTVSIRNLEFQANHGWSAAERKSARRFQVDVDLDVPIARAVESDRLTDTVNYHDVCAMIVELGQSGPNRLLESIAGKMLAALRDKFPQARVTLELRKLHPPCPGNPSHTSVRLQSG